MKLFLSHITPFLDPHMLGRFQKRPTRRVTSTLLLFGEYTYILSLYSWYFPTANFKICTQIKQRSNKYRDFSNNDKIYLRVLQYLIIFWCILTFYVNITLLTAKINSKCQ